MTHETWYASKCRKIKVYWFHSLICDLKIIISSYISIFFIPVFKFFRSIYLQVNTCWFFLHCWQTKSSPLKTAWSFHSQLQMYRTSIVFISNPLPQQRVAQLSVPLQWRPIVVWQRFKVGFKYWIRCDVFFTGWATRFVKSTEMALWYSFLRYSEIFWNGLMLFQQVLTEQEPESGRFWYIQMLKIQNWCKMKWCIYAIMKNDIKLFDPTIILSV